MSPAGDMAPALMSLRAMLKCDPASEPYMAFDSPMAGRSAQPVENLKLCSMSSFLPSTLVYSMQMPI